VAMSGIRKAAMLLTSLDPSTAAELIKSASPEVITKIAAEVAYLRSAGDGQGGDAEPVREFFGLLKSQGAGGEEDFLQAMLHGAVGAQRSRELLGRVRQMVAERDPFMPIRSAEAAHLARALKGESAQAVAVVLSELPPDKTAELLVLLEESVRTAAVCSLAAGEAGAVTRQARRRVAAIVAERLSRLRRAEGEQEQAEAPPSADEQRRKKQLRSVAVVLRSLPGELREGLVKAVTDKDAEAGAEVQRLMVTWEDLPLIPERALQEALRSVDARSLALALVGVEPDVAQRVRANISERARGMLEEEQSLLSSPKPEEIEQARDEILNALREMNAAGELTFEEGRET